MAEDLMLCLSIKQPWAWLIIHGHKDIENRRWRTKLRGRVLIHTGKTFDGDPEDWDWPKIEPPDRFDQGGIIGSVEIVDCVDQSASPWFCGPYGFVLRDPEPLPFLPCRGQLGFFKPDFMPAAPKKQSIIKPKRQESFL